MLIALARKNFKNKFPEKATEVDTWNDLTFLNKARITIKGKITRTAIILLGKEEADHYLNPAEAKVRWLLKDAKGNDKDYAIYEKQKKIKINNLLSELRKKRKIENKGTFKMSKWVLINQV
jgi:ATP-dependent DNA helicase RecG